MYDSTTIPPLKQCSRKDKCVNPLGSWLPATREYFYHDPKMRFGLKSQCKACMYATKQQWRKNNPERERAYNRAYHHLHREHRNARNVAYQKRNPEARRERGRRYYHRHKEERREQRRISFQKWYIAHPNYAREQRNKNPEQYRAIVNRRRARKLNLPNTFTAVHWQRCLEYWGYRCAICGQLPDFWHYLAQDHWIPIDSAHPNNPGTVPENILPLCHTKRGGGGVSSGCNNSKHYKEPVEWLHSRYSKKRAKQILARINAYFDWVKDQDHDPHPHR